MESLSLHTSVPTLHWEENTFCISIVKDKRVTPTVNQIDIPVCFLQENVDNGLFIPKYEKSSVIPEDMCTKPCSGKIISQGNKWMTGLRLYPTSDTKHYQLMILDEFVVN